MGPSLGKIQTKTQTRTWPYFEISALIILTINGFHNGIFHRYKTNQRNWLTRYEGIKRKEKLRPFPLFHLNFMGGLMKTLLFQYGKHKRSKMRNGFWFQWPFERSFSTFTCCNPFGNGFACSVSAHCLERIDMDRFLELQEHEMIVSAWNFSALPTFCIPCVPDYPIPVGGFPITINSPGFDPRSRH